MSSPGLDSSGTGGQQRPDAVCQYSVSVNRENSEEIKKSMDIDQLTKIACRVLKHPGCCVLCAANNDCSRLPVHWNCRCRPEGFLTFTEFANTKEV